MDKQVDMQKKYKEFFEQEFGLYGESLRSLGWNERSQADRFAALAGVDSLAGKRILDVGCGFGDFYDYLANTEKVGLKGYTGLDIVPDFIRIARSRYPEATFFDADVLSFKPDREFDYAVASGIFFLSCDAWEDYVVTVCRKMYEISGLGIAANFLSIFSPHPDDFSRYASPAKVLDLLMTHISPIAVLRHDYRQNDFTVYLYKACKAQ